MGAFKSTVENMQNRLRSVSVHVCVLCVASLMTNWSVLPLACRALNNDDHAPTLAEGQFLCPQLVRELILNI